MGPNPQQGAKSIKFHEERHFSVREIADMWSLSEDKVRDLFENEPGVVVISNGVLGRRQRRYRTFRIPESVLQRVHRRLARP